MDRFIKLARVEDSELLQHMIRHDHNAFILLTVIAQRARRMREPHPASGRKQFEAEIGDYRACGMTERMYRTAKSNLAKWGLATFKPTSKGTVATLLKGSVFDINPEGRDEQADRQATGCRQLRREVRREEGKKERERGAGAPRSPCFPDAGELLAQERFRALATPEFEAAFRAWLDWRMVSKRKPTVRSAELNLLDALKVGPEVAAAMMRDAEKNGWQGWYFEERVASYRKAASGGREWVSRMHPALLGPGVGHK